MVAHVPIETRSAGGLVLFAHSPRALDSPWAEWGCLTFTKQRTKY